MTAVLKTHVKHLFDIQNTLVTSLNVEHRACYTQWEIFSVIEKEKEGKKPFPLIQNKHRILSIRNRSELGCLDHVDTSYLDCVYG